VLAEDRFQDLRMTRRTRTFENVTDAGVAQQIANEHGLQPDVSLNGPTHQVLAQVNQSDLAFLRERTRANDAEMWVEGDKLLAKPRAQRDGGTLQLSYRGTLREFSVMADLARQATSVTASGWDVAGKSALKHEADEAVISGELNNGESGAKILQSAFGGRKEALAHTVPLTAQEAQAFAESYFRMNARRFLTGRGVAEPDAGLRVGSFVELSGLGPLFSGKYYLAEVRHRFDRKNGLRTEFIGEKPGMGRP
jgi:phage protein D